MSPPFRYCHSGLSVASDIELPEWEAFADTGTGEPDVRIVLSDEPCPDCPADGSVAGSQNLRFAIEGIGAWQIEGGHTIRLHPGLTARPEEVRLFTLGSAWGGLGYQRGFAMWHGSAVRFAGQTVLLCGDAGAGKSTMAAALYARGAALVADDLSRIEPRVGGAVIYPSSSRVKLWREAITRLDWEDMVLQRDYYREDKFHCSAPVFACADGPVRLHAIVALEEAQEASLERQTGSAAMTTAFEGTLYRAQMLDALGGWGRQGALAARIVSQIPVYSLHRPRDFTVLSKSTDLIWNLFDRDC